MRDHIREYEPVDSFGNFDFDFDLFTFHCFSERMETAPLSEKERNRALKVVELLRTILHEILVAEKTWDSKYTTGVFQAINPTVSLRYPTPEERENYGKLNQLQEQIRPILGKLEALKADLVFRNTINESDREYWRPLLERLKNELRTHEKPMRPTFHRLCA